MKLEEYQHLVNTINGRIMIEIIRCEEVRAPMPIGVIMHPKTYQKLMSEIEPSTIQIPKDKIHNLQIMITHLLPIDMAFVYKEQQFQ